MTGYYSVNIDLETVTQKLNSKVTYQGLLCCGFDPLNILYAHAYYEPRVWGSKVDQKVD